MTSYVGYYCVLNYPIHTLLVSSTLSFGPPITIIIPLSAVLTTADLYICDGVCPMASQL